MTERWWLDAGRRALLEQRAALSVAAWMHLPGETTLLSTDRQSAALRDDAKPPLLVKWRRPLPGRQRRTFLRPSRELREARALLRARALGLLCPSPWAVGERRRGGVLLGSVLIRAFDSDACSVQEEAARRPDVVGAMAAALRGWHDLGFRHGDCYPKNVLVGTGGTLLPIGCPAARFVRAGARPDPARLKDLGQLAAGCLALWPEADPFAFLDAYLREPGLPARGALQDLVRPFYDKVMARKAERIATRPQREPDGPPQPIPLPPDTQPVRVRVRGIGELA